MTNSQRSQRSITNSQRSQRSSLYYSKKLTGSQKRLSATSFASEKAKARKSFESDKSDASSFYSATSVASEASDMKSTKSKTSRSSKSYDEDDENNETKSLSDTSKASNTTHTTKLSATSNGSDLKKPTTTRTMQIFEDDNSESIMFESEVPKGSSELVAPFDDEATKNNNLAPSDFLGFIGVFFFFPFVALAIASSQDIGVERGALQMFFFYVLNALVPAFYWAHYYFLRLPIVLIAMHILLWSTATSSLVYLMVGNQYFEQSRHITIGAVLGMVSTLWHFWLVAGVCGRTVRKDYDDTDIENDDIENDDIENDDDNIENILNSRKSIENGRKSIEKLAV